MIVQTNNQISTQISAVIFDLGKVIVDWDPNYLLKRYVHDEKRRKFLVEVVLNLEWFRIVDGGYPFSKAIEERSKIYPEYANEMQLYIERWPETIRGTFEGTLEIVQELYKANYPLYVLSNWAEETWALVEHSFKFLRYFNDIIISGKVKIAKPDTAIFELARDRFGILPKQSLFIDDNAANVLAAKAVGFQALIFESPEGLKQELIKLKLLHD